MSLRMVPEELSAEVLIPDAVSTVQPTVGWEGELNAIKFVLIKQKKITLAREEEEVMSVFKPTSNGVECVQDNQPVDFTFFPKLKQIAKQKNLYLPYRAFSSSHVFEFVTHPKKTTEDVGIQFDEIAKLEADLIEYVLTQKRDNPKIGLINVKNWINKYNLRFPNNPISSTSDADSMYIAVDYSIAQLKLTEQQKNIWQKSKILSELARNIQKQLMHNVQFNFVVTLGKSMGSQLIAIFETNNCFSQAQREIKLAQQYIASAQSELERIRSNPSEFSGEEEIKSIIAANLQCIEKLEDSLVTMEKQKDILRQAEINAERACDFIRLQYNTEKEKKVSDKEIPDNPVHRKLIKIEGFCFLLSMRILTETTDIQLDHASTPKNKYLFFLKTQLSDLIHSLSENDKLLLDDIDKTWTGAQKNQLLGIVAGSSEALTIHLRDENKEDFSIKDVLESAFGWKKNVCDQFPNGATRQITPPFEPLNLRKKNAPLRRILLEYRASPYKTLSESKQLMNDMLHKATLLCKSTHMLKKDWGKWDKESLSNYIKRRDLLINNKAKFVKTLKLYNPALLNLIKAACPAEMQSIAKYQLQMDKAKLTSAKQVAARTVEENVIKAMQYILEQKSLPKKETQHFDNVKKIISDIISDVDLDITLKQINFLYLQIQEAEVISQDRKSSVIHMLVSILVEKINAFFKFPLKAVDDRYKQIDYVISRYAIIREIPQVTEYLNFIKAFSKGNPWGFGVVLCVEIHGMSLKYSFKEDVNINQPDGSNYTALRYACKFGLTNFVNELLERNAEADFNDLLFALRSGILTTDLTDQLMQAGADPIMVFFYLANENEIPAILQLIQITGDVVDQAIVIIKEIKEFPNSIICIRKAKEMYDKTQVKSTEDTDSMSIHSKVLTFARAGAFESKNQKPEEKPSSLLIKAKFNPFAELISAIRNEVNRFRTQKSFFTIRMARKANEIEAALSAAMENVQKINSVTEFLQFKTDKHHLSIKEALQFSRKNPTNKPLWGEVDSWQRIKPLL